MFVTRTSPPLLALFLIAIWPTLARSQSIYAAPYTIATLAGVTQGTVDGPRHSARFFAPHAVVADPAGNLFVAGADHAIRKISADGMVSTFAGSPGNPGSTDGPRLAARFNFPTGLAIDAAGNLFVADNNNHTIRKISSTGIVSTVAGKALSAGFVNANGAAARFTYPRDLVVDASGNIFVAESRTVRRISPSGDVITWAGQADQSGHADGVGTAATFAHTGGVAIDRAGNIFVSDTDNGTIRKITVDRAVSTIAGTARGSIYDGTRTTATFGQTFALTVDSAGFLYVIDEMVVRRVSLAGEVITWAGDKYHEGDTDGRGDAATFNYPQGITVDQGGNVFVADTFSGTIRKISRDGVVETWAGKSAYWGSVDGPAADAHFKEPRGIAVDAAGTVWVADTFNYTVRKISRNGVVSTFAGSPGEPGDDDGRSRNARFREPVGIVVDAAGNLYVSDLTSIRRISPQGDVTTVAGAAGSKGAADGTGPAATFNRPQGVALDGSGNLWVADTGNHVIRRVSPTGVVTTVAGAAGVAGSADGPGALARFNHPAGIAIDRADTIYVADEGNSAIRKITPAGVTSVLAGGSYGARDGIGAAAQFEGPVALAVDRLGVLYVAEASFYSVLRTVTPAGVVRSIAGTPYNTFPPFGNTGSGARLGYPEAIAVDALGNLYIADGVVRVAVPAEVSPGGSYFSSQPTSESVSTGDSLRLAASVESDSAVAFQWYRNGALILGATKTSYDIASAQRSDAGTYVLEATTAAGVLRSAAATISIADLPAGRLANVSGRAQVGSGENVLLAGFTLAGTSREQSSVLVRAVGPGLRLFGIDRAVAQPTLSVRDAGTRLIASNAGWETAVNPSQIASAAARVGAFPLPANGGDDALLLELAPGNYTAEIAGVGSDSGNALVEIYPTASSSGRSLTGFSLRAATGTAARVLVAGFVIEGGPASLLIRAAGPALGQFGVSTALSQPILVVRDSAQALVATNSRWATSGAPEQVAAAAERRGLFSFAAAGGDSALHLVLPPGAYTALVTSGDGTSGVGLLEVYLDD